MAERKVPWRRRLDNLSLRWEARLDSATADKVVPWSAAGFLFIVLASLSLAQTRSMLTGAELASFVQASWLINEGEPAFVTIGGGHVLADQAGFAVYPVAWLAGMLPAIPTLLILQSAALAIGVVPLWRIARRVADLRVSASVVVIAAYSLYPPLHEVNLGGFHIASLALPALLGAVLFALTDRWWLFWGCVAVVLACRADYGLVIAGVGFLLFIGDRRRQGAIAMAVGTGWTLLALFVVQPYYSDGDFVHGDAFTAYGDSPLGALGGMLTDPFGVLGDMFVEPNFVILVGLLAPVFFLPFVAPRYLLPVIPLEALYLVSNVAEGRTAKAEHAVAIAAFVFLATVFALNRIGTRSVERVKVPGRILSALLLAGTIFFIQDSPSSPYAAPWRWGVRDDADQSRLDAIDRIDDRAAVRASGALLPLLAERHEVFLLDTTGNPHVRRAAADVDVIVLDNEAATDWDDDSRRRFQEGLDALGFSEVFVENGIEVFERRG
jgi:uncharacterized membrane protein